MGRYEFFKLKTKVKLICIWHLKWKSHFFPFLDTGSIPFYQEIYVYDILLHIAGRHILEC